MGNVTAGLILVTLGAVFLGRQMGLVEIAFLWRYWPVVLITLGVAHLVYGEPGERIGGAVLNLFLGLAFLAINFNWMGLEWRSGWPLILMAVGAAMTTRALIGRRHPEAASGAEVVEEDRDD